MMDLEFWDGFGRENTRISYDSFIIGIILEGGKTLFIKEKYSCVLSNVCVKRD